MTLPNSIRYINRMMAHCKCTDYSDTWKFFDSLIQGLALSKDNSMLHAKIASCIIALAKHIESEAKEHPKCFCPPDIVTEFCCSVEECGKYFVGKVIDSSGGLHYESFPCDNFAEALNLASKQLEILESQEAI